MKGRTGFTLIEVMVAIVVFTFGVMGIAALQVAVAQANRGATNHTRADQILYDKVEELQSTPYNAISSGADIDTVGGVAFARSWTVTDNAPMNRLKTISLTATWEERGKSFDVQTSTIRGTD